MKKIFRVLLTVHLAFWVLALLLSIVRRVTYTASDAEPLDYFLSQGIYNVFILIGAVGSINAAMLFCACVAPENSAESHKKCRSVALWLTYLATLLFYASIVLLFLIQSDFVILAPAAWLLCEVCSGVLLVASRNK